LDFKKNIYNKFLYIKKIKKVYQKLFNILKIVNLNKKDIIDIEITKISLYDNKLIYLLEKFRKI
jgi:hypothetical protein